MADGSLDIIKLSLVHTESLEECVTDSYNNGTVIKQGTKIYTPGNKGDSTGTHIHAMFGISDACKYTWQECATKGCGRTEFRLTNAKDWNKVFFLSPASPFYSAESKFDFTTEKILVKSMVTNFKILSGSSEYPMMDLDAPQLTFEVYNNGTDSMEAHEYPYGAAKVTKTYAEGDVVHTKKAVRNSWWNLWFQTDDGGYVYNAILRYVETPSEVISSEPFTRNMIVKKHSTEPMNENLVPFGTWIRPVAHQPGDIVHAVRKIKTVRGSTWYVLDNGNYMWSGVLDESEYPFFEILTHSFPFTVYDNGVSELAAYEHPYSSSKLMKYYLPNDTVCVQKAVKNRDGELWYLTDDGSYVSNDILRYAELAPAVISSEPVDLAFIVKQHATQPMYENQVPFGNWLMPVAHQAGDIVYAVRKIVNSANNVWYLLSSGNYMWNGVLEETVPTEQYSLTVEVMYGKGGTASANGTMFHRGETVTLTAIPDPGYRVNCWTSDNGGTFGNPNSPNTTFLMPAGNTIITVAFVPVDYTITLSYAAGQGQMSAPATGQYGQTVEITAEADDGYYFGGWASTDIDIADEDKMKPTYRFTMPAHDVNIRAFFLYESTDLSEWQVGVEIPPYYSPDELEIQYKHQYTAVSTTSPGDGWVRGSVNRTYYQNSGKVEEFPYEKATSNTYVYVGGYYYHWCGSNSDCNYQKTAGKYETYHGPGSLDQYDVVSSGTDTNNSNIKWYRLQWKAGMMYSGLAWCATHQTANWYRMYQYQPKALVTEYNWSKETDWVDTLDPAATSYTIRWRVIKSAELSEIIVSDSFFSMIVGEPKKLEFTTVPENADLSGFVYEFSNPDIAYLDEELNIHALNTGYTRILITAPNGVTASTAIDICNNMSSWEVYINGLPTNREGTIDVYRVGQTVPYRVEYQLKNDVDPGYDLILYHEYEYPCIQDKENKTLTFIQGTVIRPNGGDSIGFDLADFNFGYGKILVTDDAESVYLPSDLRIIEEEAFRNSAAKYFFLPDGVKEIGDDAFPTGSQVFLNTQSLNDYHFACDDVVLVENGATYNDSFAQEHDNYFTRRTTE